MGTRTDGYRRGRLTTMLWSVWGSPRPDLPQMGHATFSGAWAGQLTEARPVWNLDCPKDDTG